jgi:hypothetical protein
MDTRDYFKHIRSLGAFPAAGALALAREAAALDKARDEKRAIAAGPSIAAYEVMPDGTAPVRLSFGIKVY